jgi:ABC-type sugar transport system ATPase subunit
VVNAQEPKDRGVAMVLRNDALHPHLSVDGTSRTVIV